MGRVGKYQGAKTSVCIIYRPPNCSGDVGNGIKHEIRAACDKGIPVIMGDCNLGKSNKPQCRREGTPGVYTG